MKAVDLIHQEFDYYLSLCDRLQVSSSFHKTQLRSMMKASTKRFRKMEDIMFSNAKDIDHAYEVMLRSFPTSLLPHDHPRKNNY